ncbi:MAG: hypothetical protein KBT46_07855 [Ruminococcus sp.]|nr:hypothetical protein [Candidatus Copronaster equi]
MKKNRSVLAIFLVLVMAVLPMTVFAKEETTECPTIYVHGFMGSTIYENPDDPDSPEIWPPSSDKILDAVKQAVNPILEFSVDKDWTKLAEKITVIGTELMGDIINDYTGSPVNTSGVRFKYPSASSIKRRNYTSFVYDWRVDPVEIAGQLNDFINYVLECTGSDKVNIECHSLGGVITISYLSIYGNEKINGVALNSTAIYGETYNGELMTGQMILNPQGLNEYLKYALDGTEYESLLDSAMDILTKSGAFDVICNFGNMILDKMLSTVVKGVVLPLFGHWLTIWAMIPDDYVDDAMHYAFDTVYGDTGVDRSAIINKIERYNELVRKNKTQTLLDLNDSANLYVIARYGYSSIPMTPSYTIMSDGVVDTKNASYGATVAQFGQQLSSEYLKDKDLKYISPDKTIDASTCLFPEQTWFIKGMKHSDSPDCLDELMSTLLKYDGQATVDTFEQYPRFLKYDYISDTLNADTEPEPAETFFTMLKNVILDIIKLFKQLFSSIIK